MRPACCKLSRFFDAFDDERTGQISTVWIKAVSLLLSLTACLLPSLPFFSTRLF